MCETTTAIYTVLSFIYENDRLVKKMIIIFNKSPKFTNYAILSSTQRKGVFISQVRGQRSLDLGHDVVHVDRDSDLLLRSNRGTRKTEPMRRKEGGGRRVSECVCDSRSYIRGLLLELLQLIVIVIKLFVKILQKKMNYKYTLTSNSIEPTEWEMHRL